MDNQPAYSPTGRPVSENEPGDHLRPLPDANWAVWTWTGLRGAGFPISHVLHLAMPTCAAAADLLLAREAEVEQAQKKALAALSDEIEKSEGDARTEAFKVRRRVKHGKQLPSSLNYSSGTQMDLESLQAAYIRREQAYAEFQTHFSSATAQSMLALHEIAQSERFREAVTWQNRGGVCDGINVFLNKVLLNNPTSGLRKQGQLIAKYLQRYCAKNDTIGFFGPIGWGRWVNVGADLTVYPGQRLLATRTVYFETWAIDALSEMLARNSALLPWATPRPLPFLSLSGTTLYLPFARPLQLPAAQATVLAACDGQKTAREVAQTVLATALPELTSEADVFAILHQLRNTRRIAWTFEVSAEEWHPERALRRQLERITPESLCAETLDKLERLEAARAAVVDAAENVVQLNQALEQLETTFTALTGQAATREAGKTYAARTLVYEDCQRDIELTLGPALLQELGRPLALLLMSARWFTYTAAQFYLQAFRETYRKLSQKSGSPTVEFATFWSLVQPLMPVEANQPPIAPVIAEFQKRWATLLKFAPDQRRVHYTSQDLQPRVQEVFHAPYAGWRSARYHSPDLLISAASPEAVLRGEYQLVLGEFHQGINTLDVVALASSHPTLSDLLRSIEADLPEPRVIPLLPRNVAPAKRGHSALTLAKDWRLLFGADSGGVSAERALPIGLLVLEECDGELVVHTRDRSRTFPLLEIFDGLLSLQVGDAFKLLAPAFHTPRITIDRLVICREAWRFTPAELPWAFKKDALERFVELRRWARMHQMPRYLFVRTPHEKKPFYLDLDSPVYVEMFARLVCQARAVSTEDAVITVTEMLPDPAHCWLPDSAGNRYTSELRVIAVDQVKLHL